MPTDANDDDADGDDDDDAVFVCDDDGDDDEFVPLANEHPDYHLAPTDTHSLEPTTKCTKLRENGSRLISVATDCD